MKGETIFGIIIMAVCSFGCGLLFYGIGIWSCKQKNPVAFWSGSRVDPKTIMDISAYNHANSRMWKRYSMLYFLSGFLSLITPFHQSFLIISVIPLVFAGTVGIWWLIYTYRKIENQYKMQ